MTTNNVRKFIPLYIISFLTIVLLITSVIIYSVKNDGSRRTIIFPSVDEGKYFVETRYLPENPGKSDVAFYIDEVLLGPGMERSKYLFTPNTKVLSCFEREGILYLNLSEDLLKMGDNVIEIKDGMELLKKNIFMNFDSVKKVEIFVNGKYAYEEKK